MRAGMAVALVAVIGLGAAVVACIRNPLPFELWLAHTGLGIPVVGSWQGGLRTQGGAQLAMYAVLLMGDEVSNVAPRVGMQGEARVCNALGDVYRYKIRGRHTAAGLPPGAQFVLSFLAASGPPEVGAFSLSGSWQNDIISLSGVSTFAPDGTLWGTRPRTGPNGDMSVQLRRGSEDDFAAGCKGLAPATKQ